MLLNIVVIGTVHVNDGKRSFIISLNSSVTTNRISIFILVFTNDDNSDSTHYHIDEVSKNS